MTPPRDRIYPLDDSPPGPPRNAGAFASPWTPKPVPAPQGSVSPESHEHAPPAGGHCAGSEKRPGTWRVPSEATVCRPVDVSASAPRWTQVIEAATGFFGRGGRSARRGASYLWISRGWIVTTYVWLIPDQRRSRLHLCSEWQDLFPLLGLASLLTALAFTVLLDTLLTPTDPTGWLLAAMGLAMLFAGGWFGFRAWIRRQKRRLTRLADHLTALLTDPPSEV